LRPTAIELAFKTAAEMVLFDSYQGYTGDLRDLHTFEAFDEAVKNRLPDICSPSAIGTVISQRVHRDVAPETADVAAGGRLWSKEMSLLAAAITNHGPGPDFRV
jgi:formate C-acetyltransferase